MCHHIHTMWVKKSGIMSRFDLNDKVGDRNQNEREDWQRTFKIIEFDVRKY